MYSHRQRLVIFDADGTLIDAFSAVEAAFARNGMDLGNLERFQKRRKLFKYLGGLREFPRNLRRQFGRQSRKALLATLTEIYREEARLFPGFAALLNALFAQGDIRVGLLTRNVTRDPEETLRRLFARHAVDLDAFDFVRCIPLDGDKGEEMRHARAHYGINPALGYACGDEHRDYLAAQSAGLNAFIAAYGFEDRARLVDSFDVPEAVIASTPEELQARLRHALGLG